MLQIQLNASHLNSRPLNATRVTAPFDKIVTENPCRNSSDHVSTMSSSRVNTSDGSDHDLESMISCFLEEDEEIEPCCSSGSRPDLSDDCECGSDTERPGERILNPFFGEQLRQKLQGISSSTTPLEQMLQRDAAKAIGLAKEKAGILIENDRQKSSLRRFVMNSLRCAGYNAGICKSRWHKTNGYPAGDYEFIDVVVEGCRSMARGARLLVDIGFAAQFEIARPTDEYCTLVEVLPTLFVGSEDKLRQMIRIMCDEAKRSLKTKEMPIPPWRKYHYVQAKWLGPYRRTIPAASASTAHLPGEYIGVSELKGTRMGWELHL